MRTDIRRLLPVLLLTAALAGCQTGSDAQLFFSAKSQPVMSGSVAPADPADAAPVSEDLGLGRKHFTAGEYGLAEKHFRLAVEASPEDAEAWLGLAAAYDQLKRFDLADPAYAETVKLVGETAEVLNNRGYSHMLRGEFRKARRDLRRAARRDPENPQIKANLQLLKVGRSGRA